jgi:hypothetical protein
MKNPLEAAQDLIDCFKWDLDGAMAGHFDESKVSPGRPIPMETWKPVIIALRKFLNGECESLDKAFGSQTRSYRRAAARARERSRIQWLVQSFADEYKNLPAEEKLQNVSPKDFGISEVAELFGMTVSNVEDIFNGDR